MRSAFFFAASALGAAVGLAGCAAHYSVLQHPDDSQRIEDSMRPPAAGEKLPDPIELGDEAPPLAPETPETGAGYSPLMSGYGYGISGVPAYGVGFGAVAAPVPGATAGGSEPGSLQPGIKARPGGSLPGLLP